MLNESFSIFVNEKNDFFYTRYAAFFCFQQLSPKKWPKHLQDDHKNFFNMNDIKHSEYERWYEHSYHTQKLSCVLRPKINSANLGTSRVPAREADYKVPGRTRGQGRGNVVFDVSE